jgi:exoribonuclease II
MFLEGQIIEFLDVDQLKPGYVRKQERDRLQVIDPRGRHLSMNGDRVVVVHAPSGESEFPGMVRGIMERVQSRQSEVDVELLWQSLGGVQREFLPTELAEIFFSESSPEAASAIFRALSEDTLFFKRNGIQFVPKTEAQVSTEQIKRQRQREREDAHAKMTALMTRLIRNGKQPVTADLDPVLDRIHNWLRNKTGDEAATILEQIVGPNRARDVAYDILLSAGRIDPENDRFLVSAGIDERFPSVVISAGAALAPYVHTDARLDYRNTPALTIDDEDTLEVDDAITLRRENDEFVVGIHIADVSGFVGKGDVLDAEASKRSSTIYLPTKSVRMFPEPLSIDLGSLREDADRPAMTMEVRFDPAFNRLGYRLAMSTVRVHRRLTYDDADQLIQQGHEDLNALHQIALHLQRERADHGAITMRRPELKLRVRDGRVHIKKLDPNAPSRILVSEMMILMNRLAADFASIHTLPIIFRTQEPRDVQTVDETPAIEALAFERLRRTFKRSRLSLTPGLHSGLGVTAYTQVSSPIRRYSDLITQRQFAAKLQDRPVQHNREELQKIMATAESAEAEVRSLEERSSHYWLIQYLAQQPPGDPLSAMILDRKGTVELQDYYLRARIADSGSASIGDVVPVAIEHSDPLKGEIRLRRT